MQRSRRSPLYFLLYFQGATLSCNNLHESWVKVLQPFRRSFKVVFGCFQTSPATWHITDSLSLGTLLLGAFCKSASFVQLSGSTGCQYVGRCSGERLQPSDKHSGGFRVVWRWSAVVWRFCSNWWKNEQRKKEILSRFSAALLFNISVTTNTLAVKVLLDRNKPQQWNIISHGSTSLEAIIKAVWGHRDGKAANIQRRALNDLQDAWRTFPEASL